MATMTKEELDAFTQKLAELTAKGSEQEIRAYVEYHYPRLPEEVRQRFLLGAFFDAAKEKLQEEQAIRVVQEEGIAAAEALENLDGSEQGAEERS